MYIYSPPAVCRAGGRNGDLGAGGGAAGPAAAADARRPGGGAGAQQDPGRETGAVEVGEICGLCELGIDGGLVGILMDISHVLWRFLGISD